MMYDKEFSLIMIPTYYVLSKKCGILRAKPLEVKQLC